MSATHRTDRAVGAVVGSALGDALGAPWEFTDGTTSTEPLELTGGGGFGWAPGEWTDDTQMATAILSAAATGSDDVEQVAAGFLAWFASGPADIGIQTSSVLGDTDDPAELTSAALRHLIDRPNAAGNGSLMRTAPVALFHPDDRDATARLAADISRLTHAHSDCVASCVLWTEAIRRLITSDDSEPPTDWIAFVAEGLDLVADLDRDRWHQLIESTRGTEPAAFVPKNGWVVDAFRQAIATIATTPAPAGWHAPDHALDCLERICRAGNDADTVAAIAGGMLGAAWGGVNLPPRHVSRLNGEFVIANGVDRVGVAALDHAARLAMRAGQPDSWGWPGVSQLLPRYRDELAPERRLVEVQDGLRFGTTADVADALSSNGPVTVISLCRMGSDDIPVPNRTVGSGIVDSVGAHPHLTHALAGVADLIQARLEAGESVFVHCVAAQTRTPSAYAAWRVRHDGATPDFALEEAERLFDGPYNPDFIEAIGQLADS